MSAVENESTNSFKSGNITNTIKNRYIGHTHGLEAFSHLLKPVMVFPEYIEQPPAF